MSEVKRYECLLIEDAPRLQAILPQGAVVCSERTQMMVTAEDYATLEAEAQALREELKNRTVECNGLHEMLRQEHDRTDKAREEVAALKEARDSRVTERLATMDRLERERDDALRARVVVPDGWAILSRHVTDDMYNASGMVKDAPFRIWEKMFDAAPRLNGKAVSEGLLRSACSSITRLILSAQTRPSCQKGMVDPCRCHRCNVDRALKVDAELRALLGEGKEVGDVLVRE